MADAILLDKYFTAQNERKRGGHLFDSGKVLQGVAGLLGHG